MQSSSHLIEKINNNQVKRIDVSKEMSSGTMIHEHVSDLLQCSYIAATPDFKLIGVRNDGGIIHIYNYDIATQNLNSTTLKNQQSTKMKAILSPEGKCLVMSSPESGKLISLDLATLNETVIHESPMYSGQIAMSFEGSRDNQLLIISGKNTDDPGEPGWLKWYMYRNGGFGDYLLEYKAKTRSPVLPEAVTYASPYSMIYYFDSSAKMQELHYQSKANATQVNYVHGQTILKYLTRNRDGNILLCKTYFQDKLDIVYLSMKGDFIHERSIHLKDEIIKEVKVISDELILVKTNLGIHLCNFQDRKDLGILRNQFNLNLLWSGKSIIFQYGSALCIGSLHEPPNFDDLFSALLTNTSVTEVNLIDVYLTNEHFEKLYQLMEMRHDIKFSLSPEIIVRISMKTRIANQEKEIQTLKVHKIEEEKMVQSRLSEIEAALKASDEKNSEELQRLKEESLQSRHEMVELKNALLEERERHTESIKQMTRMIKSSVTEHPSVDAKTSVISAIALEVRAANELSDDILQKLMYGATVVDLNLIKFSTYLTEEVRSSLKARGAILSVEDLITTVKEVNAYSSKEKLARLLFAVEALIQDHMLLNDVNKNALHAATMAHLLADHAKKLNDFPEVKNQYVAMVREAYEDPSLNLDAIPIPPKLTRELISFIFDHEAKIIAPCVTDYLLSLSNHLKQCSDPQAAQIAELKQEIAMLKRAQSVSFAANGQSLFSNKADARDLTDRASPSI